ncbi:hypothetical protein CANMA_001914 [Candida margitis]|uniref:uncharacterized protein n=1 Tax=Candida margitis TaxID=1775924 RepID=UPI0022266BA3|nr:uncharacterized protein CANMA_001914 [Candida margitis]KAI5969062.1 hypothetical protein CANMA_001914 [Candida margitis]
MPIQNYFQLTVHLVAKYVESIYPSSQDFKLVQTTNEQKLSQSEIYYNNEKFLIVSITEISTVQSLINLLNLDGRLDNALINWEWFDLDEITFPIKDESNLPQDLVEKFNTKFRYIIDNEKVSSIFAHPNKQSGGPIVEEQHTDTESNFARSPTPEVPYQPTNPTFAGGNPSAEGGGEANPTFTRQPDDMPKFEDEYQIKDRGPPVRDTLGQSTHFPPIGSDDLNPPGIPSNPTLQGYIDPLQAPQGGVGGNFGGGGAGGGMHPTPDHPIFGQGQHQGVGGRKGVPPGARYSDPYSEDNLDNLGQGLPSNFRGPGSGGRGNFGGYGSGGSSFGNFGPPGGGANL